MARNIAKRFATMTLLYWAPEYSGTSIKYGTPVSFKGFYIGNASFGEHGLSAFISSNDAKNENMVLFYMLEPQEGGYVSWESTLAELTETQMVDTAPSHITGTKKIKKVIKIPMVRSKTVALENMAFVCTLE